MRRALVVLVGIGCQARSIDHGVAEVESRFAEDAAAAYCETMVQCGCPAHWAPYQDVDACVDEEAAVIAERQRRAQEAGLLFDPDCADFTVQRWRDIGCDSFADAAERLRPGQAGLFPRCQLYFGSVAEADECETAFGTHWDNCERGTACFDEDGCQPIAPAIVEVPGRGEPCWVGGGHAALYSCEPELYCTGMDGSATCQPYAAEGEDCSAQVCPDGLRCDYGITDTCQRPWPLGAACDELSALGCEDGLFCDHEFIVETMGTCQPEVESGGACRLPDACQVGWCHCGPDEGVCDGACDDDLGAEDPVPEPPSPVICEPSYNLQPAEMF